MASVSVLRRSGLAATAIAFAAFCTVAAWTEASGQVAPVPGAAVNGAVPVPAHRTHSAKGPGHGHAAKPEPQPLAVQEAPPPPPPPPDWPVNDKAVQASVDWNGRNLSIAATNSSLQQILHDVSTATGVKVEGDAADERIYGSFGPAPAREVLTELLDGSGYNVLMVGDKGEGTPRELVLTARTQVAPQSAAGNVQNGQNSEEEQPEEPEPVDQSNPGTRRPFGVNPPQPGQGRTPEQVIQEMQQRQQLLQQQQQAQPQQPQPNPQPPND
jgi:hypothetical protein